MSKKREVSRRAEERIPSIHHGLTQPVWTVQQEQGNTGSATHPRAAESESEDEPERSGVESSE